MSPTSHPRSTRDRPAKTPLSEAAVVDAALTILATEGLDAVTMRRVAAALDTGPASLYVYVSGREALLAAILDRVTESIALEPPDPARWRDQLHALLQRMRVALVAHPGLAALTLADPPTTEAILRVAENLLGILMAGGIDAQDAAWATDIFTLLVTAVAIEDDVRRGRGADLSGQVEQLRETFAVLPPDRFPLIVAHATQMVAGDSDQRFRWGVDVVIAGLLSRSPGPATAK
jgi:AcrR family transcriptional regulator